MKYKYTLLKLLILCTLICCDKEKNSISKDDLNKIELLLSKHKRFAFVDFYEKSIKKDEKKFNLKKCDSLFDMTSTQLYHEYCLKVDFYSEDHPTYEDKNYDALISKWLNKKYPVYMPPDDPNIKTTFAFKRALDFYESDDLEKYIDSLRVVFYSKHKNSNLKSIKCLDLTSNYIENLPN